MKMESLKFKYGIFDTDGTLIDNRKIYRWILPKILPFSFLDSELSLPTTGFPIPGWAKIFHRIPGLAKAVLLAERLTLKLADFLDFFQPRLFEGTEEVLSQFEKRGLKLFATTGSKTQRAIDRLRDLGILEFFTLVIGSELPKKEHFKVFAQRVNLSLEDFAKEAFFISDSPIDLNLAKKSGIYSIGISTTFKPEYLFRAGAKKVISNLKELCQ
jgi:phosphoglycolate phosphatase-like HAD superfamily hydrolase